jgi:RNA polymerase sigma-70 factor (ECF subfamily)
MKPWAKFEDMIMPHLNHLRTYCFYLTASKWEAEDLRQETLLRAFSQYNNSGEVRYPRALLLRIARNLHIDAHRRRRGTIVPIDEAVDQPYNDPNYASVRGLLEWLAENLSEREVDMLMLAEVFHYSYQDIADELHCSVPAVKMVLHRSKRSLRKRLEGHASVEETAPVKPKRKTSLRRSVQMVTVERWTKAVLNYERYTY